MRTCPEKEELVLYAAEEVESARAAALGEHLRSCDACRHEIDTLRRGLRALECLPRKEALRPQVVKAVRRKALRPRIIQIAWQVRWVAAAAAVLLAVGLWWDYAQTLVSSRPESQEMAAQSQDPILELAAAIELLSSSTTPASEGTDLSDSTTDTINEMNLLLESLSNESSPQG